MKALWEKQGGRCAYTGELLIPGVNASLDHKIPSTRGGTNDLENLQWVTYQVNRMKTDMLEEEFFRLCRMVLEGKGFSVVPNWFPRKNP